MICPICLEPSNAGVIKVKCCKQQYHVNCLDQWVKVDKFSCPTCLNEGNFMASLPFQKFKLANGDTEQELPGSYKGQVAIRLLLTKALDDMFELRTHCYLTSSEIIGAERIIVRMARNSIRRSTTDDHGFFFDYKSGQVWINVECRFKVSNSVTFNLVLDDA